MFASVFKHCNTVTLMQL